MQEAESVTRLLHVIISKLHEKLLEAISAEWSGEIMIKWLKSKVGLEHVREGGQYYIIYNTHKSGSKPKEALGE